MAVKKDCPKCNSKNVDVTKKGYNAAGQQRWRCTKCGKTFVVEGSPIIRKPLSRKSNSKSVKVTSIKSKKITEIKVNNNSVKTVNRDIDENEAFKLVSDYFREVTKTNVNVKHQDGKKIITFSVSTGKKGF